MNGHWLEEIIRRYEEGRDFNLIITDEAGPSPRPHREWRCSECQMAVNWPGYPTVPCPNCNCREGDFERSLYEPRPEDDP